MTFTLAKRAGRPAWLGASLAILALPLAGCLGSGGGSNDDVLSGTFVDSPVAGLDYHGSQTAASKTGDSGEFGYRSGEILTQSRDGARSQRRKRMASLAESLRLSVPAALRPKSYAPESRVAPRLALRIRLWGRISSCLGRLKTYPTSSDGRLKTYPTSTSGRLKTCPTLLVPPHQD